VLSCWLCVWASTGVTTTTTAAAMATTYLREAQDQQPAPTASRTASTSPSARKGSKKSKQGEGGEQSEGSDFVHFLIACLLATQKLRPDWNTRTERFHAPLPWETLTAASFAACESKGACTLTSWLESAWPCCAQGIPQRHSPKATHCSGNLPPEPPSGQNRSKTPANVSRSSASQPKQHSQDGRASYHAAPPHVSQKEGQLSRAPQHHHHQEDSYPTSPTSVSG
jgi:hypothetical protein